MAILINPRQPSSALIFPDKPLPKKAMVPRPASRVSAATSMRGDVKECIEKGIAGCKSHGDCAGNIIRGCIKGALGWPVPNPDPWWAGAQISPRNIAMLKRQGMRNPTVRAALSGERVPGMNRRQRRQLRRTLRASRVTRGTCDPACPKDTPVCCGDGRCVSKPSTCWEDAYRNNPASFGAFVTAKRARRKTRLKGRRVVMRGGKRFVLHTGAHHLGGVHTCDYIKTEFGKLWCCADTDYDRADCSRI